MAENTAEKREFMPPPSTLRGDVNWQAQGWRKPWQPILSWAETTNHPVLKGVQEAEERLSNARKIDHPSSVLVLNAQSSLARSYHFLEEAYHNSFKTRRS